jgi:K+/H+ antiporter YhaU regulatory subunit KhtT
MENLNVTQEQQLNSGDRDTMQYPQTAESGNNIYSDKEPMRDVDRILEGLAHANETLDRTKETTSSISIMETSQAP